MRRVAAAAVLFIIAGHAPAAMAQKSPEKIRLDDRSKDGAVLIRVPTQPFDYALSFSKNGKSGFGSRVYVMKVPAGPPGYTYIARTLSPGSYRLDSVWQQSHWSICLEQGTFAFPVMQGRISFVGTFHADHLLGAIQAGALATDRTVLSGSDYMMSRDTAPQPVIDGRDAAGEAAARAFADGIMNGSGSRVELAPVDETAFATSKFGKAIKICG